MIVSIGDSFNNSINESDASAPTTVSKRKKQWVMPNDNYWDGVAEKPKMTETLWDEEQKEELARYIYWHSQHPHCVTPRPFKGDQKGGVHLVGRQIVDERNPELFYTLSAVDRPMINDPQFIPTDLGLDGEISTVASIACDYEYNSKIEYISVHEDPWYIMSVKDNLEQSHIDGDHTTVKTKKKKRKKLTDFEKEMEWQKESFNDYQGGPPPMTQNFLEKIGVVALDDKSLLHAKKRIVGPWEAPHDYTQFTKDGTALDEYNRVELNLRINQALVIYETEMAALSTAGREYSSRSKKRKSNKKLFETSKVAPEVVDPYEEMLAKIGGDKAADKITKKLMKLAAQTAKKNKKEKDMVNLNLDIVESCEKLRVNKIRYMFTRNSLDPDVKNDEDEPLFIVMFQRANAADVQSGRLNIAESKGDSSDRKKMQSILNLFHQNKANLNNLEGREGLAPAHMAAKSANLKLGVWLIKHGADFNLESKYENMTALMYASKYAYIHFLAEIIRLGVNVNYVNSEGRTALHYAALNGQTRTAQFLMRVGAKKTIRDKDHNVAAQLAFENNFTATGQAIASFAIMKPDVKSQLQYIVDEPKRQKKTTISKVFNNIIEKIDISKNLKEGARFIRRGLQKMFKYVYAYVMDKSQEEMDILEAALEDEMGFDEVEDEQDDLQSLQSFDASSLESIGSNDVVPF